MSALLAHSPGRGPGQDIEAAHILEWMADLFADHVDMDADSRHVLLTFLLATSGKALRACLVDDGTLVLGLSRQAR